MTLRIPGEHASGSAASRFAYDVFVVHADAAADEAFAGRFFGREIDNIVYWLRQGSARSMSSAPPDRASRR